MADAHTTNLVTFLNYNGQRGTEKQVERLRRQFPESQAHVLRRMLAERGLEVR
jgi:hypothetical protein